MLSRRTHRETKKKIYETKVIMDWFGRIAKVSPETNICQAVCQIVLCSLFNFKGIFLLCKNIPCLKIHVFMVLISYASKIYFTFER